MDISKISNYELYAKRPQAQAQPQGGNSVNPFMGGETRVAPPSKPENGPLDAGMLAEKKAMFENGLGGTNNRDDHKLFLTA